MPANATTAHVPAHAWFIYALGGGWGHLNRALALAQVVATSYRPVHLLVNSPYAKTLVPKLQNSHLTLHLLPKTESLNAAKQIIQSTLASIDYGCLIVDTFPRGLVGELADVLPQKQEICRVLVHRDLSPDYIKDKDLETFVRQHYDGLLIPGEQAVPFAHLPQTKLTAPWLSRSATELITQPLSYWNLSLQAPFIVVCAAGQPHELDIFGHITHQLVAAFPNIFVRCLAATCPTTCAPELWLSHWPGMDVLQFADGVVGSGGYNLVHECAALGVPLIGFALPRRYDRQERRIRQYGRLVTDVEEAIAAVRSLLDQKKVLKQKSVRRKANYENGVLAAIAHIEAWLNDKNRTKQQAQ